MSVSKKGDTYGTNYCNSPSVRGHYRPIDNDTGVSYVLRSGVLYDVGRGLDKSGNIEYIRTVFVPRSDQQGEK